MALLKWFLVAVVSAYLALLAAMYVSQRALMYKPDPAHTAPAAAGLVQADEITLASADGERILAWFVPPHEGKPLVIYFHGNGGALQHRAKRFAPLVADGTGLLAVSYRGYGGSSGSPSEKGFIADGAAAYDFAAARYPAQTIVLWGESIGSGVAVPLATEKKVGAVVLEAPFTSAAEIAAARYFYIPVRLLMIDQFRSDAKIGALKAPLLIMHGTKDQVVPIALGERLFALAPEPKRFLRLVDGGHNNLDDHGALKAAKAFLADVIR